MLAGDFDENFKDPIGTNHLPSNTSLNCANREFPAREPGGPRVVIVGKWMKCNEGICIRGARCRCSYGSGRTYYAEGMWKWRMES